MEVLLSFQRKKIT